MKKGSLLLIALLMICLLLSGCGKTEIAFPAAQGEAAAQNDQAAPPAEETGSPAVSAAEKTEPPAVSDAAEELPQDDPAPTEAEPLVEYGEPSIRQWVELGDAAEPNFQIMVPVTNLSGDYLSLRNASYTLRDEETDELHVFECADCAPVFLAPGQSGIIYYTAIERNGVDYPSLADTLEYEAEFFAMDAGTVVPLPVENVQFGKNLGSIEITGDLVNDTGYDFDLPYVSFLFYDEDGNVLCGAFCMGGNSDYDSEDFGRQPAGTTMPFKSLRYWLPDDYPPEKAHVAAFGFGLHY